jgi:proteasome lid subunit RPN8/RPN11
MLISHPPVSMRIAVKDWEEMRSDVALKAPQEACGMIAGQVEGNIYQVKAVIPATNVLRSPVRFRIDPQEQLAAFNRFEEQDWELLGIYHSHPNGPDEPSPTDIAEAFYPEAVYLIWSCRTGAWNCRGFMIRDGAVSEISLLLAH